VKWFSFQIPHLPSFHLLNQATPNCITPNNQSYTSPTNPTTEKYFLKHYSYLFWNRAMHNKDFKEFNLFSYIPFVLRGFLLTNFVHTFQVLLHSRCNNLAQRRKLMFMWHPLQISVLMYKKNILILSDNLLRAYKTY